MQTLTEDIVQFVHTRFPRTDIVKVYSALADGGIRTPRVIRAVLFLSGGSMALLHHYIGCAITDVRRVLTWAEYVVDVSEEPMWVRDLSKPFTHARNAVH